MKSRCSDNRWRWVGAWGDHAGMALVTTTDTATLLRLADAVVAADPVRNTVFGAIAFGVQQGDTAGWAAYVAEDPMVVAMRSQPYTAVTFTAGWTDLTEVVAALADLDPPPAAVAGPRETAEAVAAALGAPVTDRMDERLFRLDRLIAPHPVAGSARAAGVDDADFLADWYVDFTVEAFGRLPPGFDARKMVQQGVVRSRCWLWSGDDGAPLSFAVRHPAVRGAARIGPVYTPPQHRGNGYGSAATAAASQDILDEGAVPCLYTDLANPTSNKVYQALGYEPVLDRTMLRFD
jgi:RimJ/RimL family protein N-acetyltransferase